MRATGTRETAFIHAISAAGVAHAVTTACSSGTLEKCGCDRTVDQRVGAPEAQGGTAAGVTVGVAGAGAMADFEWAGCSDNIAYGSAFSGAFVDARERVKGAGMNRALMNLHNNNVGRKVIL